MLGLAGRIPRASCDAVGDALIVDGRLAYGQRISVRDDDAHDRGQTFTRAAVDKPQPAPARRGRGLIGEYGWDHDILYIFEKDGKLCALIEWF